MPRTVANTPSPNRYPVSSLVGASIGIGAALTVGAPLRRRVLGAGPLAILIACGVGAVAGGAVATMAMRRRRLTAREIGPPPIGSRALPPGRPLHHDVPEPDAAPSAPDPADLRRNRETDWTDDVTEELADIDIHEGLVNRSRPPMESMGAAPEEAPRSTRGAPVGDLEPERFAGAGPEEPDRGARLEARGRVEPGMHEPFDAHVGDRGEPGQVHGAAYELGVELARASSDRRLNRLEVEDLARERWEQSRYASVPFEEVVDAVHRGYTVATGA